jgi:hypothetical protein
MAHQVRGKEVSLRMLLGAENRVARLKHLPVLEHDLRRRGYIHCAVAHLVLASNLFRLRKRFPGRFIGEIGISVLK